MFHLQSIVWSETYCGKKCWGNRKRPPFSTFERFSMLCPKLQSWTWSTPSRCNQGRYMPCACVRFQHYTIIYSLHCFGSSVALQNLVKIKGLPGLFFLFFSTYSLLYIHSSMLQVASQTAYLATVFVQRNKRTHCLHCWTYYWSDTDINICVSLAVFCVCVASLPHLWVFIEQCVCV
jgi:hypothetical protein